MQNTPSLPGYMADETALNLIADAVRCGEVTAMAVVRVGSNYQTWAKVDPEPFELKDEAGRLLWKEGIGAML